jgi:hypothetical protein
MNLDKIKAINSLGFCFAIKVFESGLMECRNDVLIALKQINPNFFSDFLEEVKNLMTNQKPAAPLLSYGATFFSRDKKEEDNFLGNHKHDNDHQLQNVP